MRTTTLGTHGPQVGVIGLGCMGMTFSYDMATPRDDDTSIAVIRAALDGGVSLIDTADVYGPYTNEELVGQALAWGHRERAVLATKVGLVVSDPTGGPDNSHLIVNNASTLGPSPLPRLDGYPLDELRLVYETNVVAPLALVQEALPLLHEEIGRAHV